MTRVRERTFESALSKNSNRHQEPMKICAPHWGIIGVYDRQRLEIQRTVRQMFDHIANAANKPEFLIFDTDRQLHPEKSDPTGRVGG